MKMKKKLLALALAVVSCFTLTACGSDEGKELQDMDLSKYLQLGEYTDIEITPVLQEVTDKDVQAQMEYLFGLQAKDAGIKDRAVENGDIANIDFAGYLDGVAFDGGTGNSDLEIGSGTFIPGFEEGLIGVMPGEEIDLPLTFPADYHSADLAGKEVVFKVTVNYIIPEISDETVKALGNENYSNVAELEAFAREIVQEEVDGNNYDTVVRVATQRIIANTTFKEIPDFLIEQQKTIVKEQVEYSLQGTNIDVDTYLTMFYGSSLEEIAEQNVKERMVIQAIANAEGITVTDEELDGELEGFATDYGVTTEQILQMMGTDRAYYREYMYGVKVYDFIYNNTKVSEAQ